MKKFTTLNALLLLTLVVFLIPSCDKTPIDNTKIVVNYDLINTKLNFKFIDGATGAQIGQSDKNTNVTITVTGPNKDVVLDITGVKLKNNSAESVNGFITLGLNPNTEYTPTADNPIEFTVVAQADGYISTSMPIRIYEEGNYQYRFAMVKLDAPPAGVTVEQNMNAGNLTNGQVADDITVQTNGAEASITFNQGMTMTDENGAPLDGNISVMVTHFDNLEDQSLAAFPGGLTPMVNQDGDVESGVFYSAGFAAIEVTDASGKKAAQFSNGTATLEMIINPQTYNPETKGPVKPGDEIPLYSYDPETGSWTFEKTVVVEETAKGLTVTTEISHLSYWNLDWFESDNCDYGITLNFTIDQDLCTDSYLIGTIRKAEDNSFISMIYLYLKDGDEQQYQLMYAPSGIPVYIEWEQDIYSSTPFVYTVQPAILPIPDLCENTEYNLSISAATIGPRITVNISAYCPDNPDYIIYPSFGGWYRPVDCYCWKYVNMINGHVEICNVQIGETYIVGAYYYGEWYQKEITVTQTLYDFMNIELSPDVCEDLTGGW